MVTEFGTKNWKQSFFINKKINKKLWYIHNTTQLLKE